MALDLSRFIARFIEEARDHLRQLSEGLAALDTGAASAETVNALFRSAHTIKGSSRMLKLMPVCDTAHRLEDVLGLLRERQRPFDGEMSALLYRAVDALSAMVDVLADHPVADALPAPDPELLAALAAMAQPRDGAEPAPPAISAPPQPSATQASPSQPSPPSPDPAAVQPAPSALSVPPTPAPRAVDTVRLRLDRLDGLIKLMGEVVSSHDRLRSRVGEVRRLEQALAEAAPALSSGLHRFSRALRDDVQQQEALMQELRDRALSMRMLPLTVVFEPMQRLVRELARSVGKDVECVVDGADIELDRQIIDRLSDPLTHLVRNAIDHGLELPAVRVQSGKAARGRLRLSARQEGARVVIKVADDGAGIPLAAVRDKAVRKSLISADEAAGLSDPATIDLIFRPGFSTSAIITDLSGRGVGMDVVREAIVDDLQGVIEVDTAPGKGTVFLLRLPVSLAVMRVLLVSSGGATFGFTAQYVAELVTIDPGALVRAAERDAFILRNEFVPVVPLAALLGLALPTSDPPPRQVLVVLRVRNEKLAVRVDALLDERDLVIRPLPPHLGGLSMVSGMVDGAGHALVGVLHAPALLTAARRMRARPEVATNVPAMTGEAHAPAILVVDDSLNTREIEKDVLEAAGYRVTLAEDGVDGLDKALAGDFDAVLTDVEMPRMDGFTLTEQLRRDARYALRPIVIITSREKESDKQRGVEVGADAYIVKGDFDQNRLAETLKMLLG